MNERHTATAGVTVVLFTLVLGCATPAGVKPAQQWDQAAVTTLSSELVSRVGDAATAANEQAVRPDQMESISAHLDNLRILERQCRKLQSELRSGEGYQATLWTYGEIKRFYGVVLNSPSWQMIGGDLASTEASVSAVLDKLDGYYGKR
jgi:hypothetical protein